MSVFLITAARSAQSHALKTTLSAETILMGDYHPMPNLSGKTLFQQLPSPQSASYVHEFLAFCLCLEIERVYVLDAAEVIRLQSSLALFEEYGIQLLLNELVGN